MEIGFIAVMAIIIGIVIIVLGLVVRRRERKTISYEDRIRRKYGMGRPETSWVLFLAGFALLIVGLVSILGLIM